MKESAELSDTLSLGKITTEEIPHLARRGVSAHTINHMVREKTTTLKKIAYVLGINERTVRTYQKEESTLSPQQSEQLLKYHRLLSRGKETFGSADAFNRWLHKPAFGLDNEIPLDFLDHLGRYQPGERRSRTDRQR